MKKYILNIILAILLLVSLAVNLRYVRAGKGLDQTIDRLVKRMEKERNILNQADAVTALGMIGNRRAVAPLIKYLKTGKRNHIRVNAVKALGRIGDKKAVPVLIEALEKDSYLYVRAQAARALGEMKVEEALPALEKALEDDEPSVRRAAAYALRAITGKKYEYEREAGASQKSCLPCQERARRLREERFKEKK